MNIDRLEERLLGEIREEWERWRAYPSGITRPDCDLKWELIRMCRHVQEYGYDSLKEQQVKKLSMYKDGRLTRVAA